MSAPLSCLGAIAIELAPGAEPAHHALAREPAGDVALLAARDLARLVPGASGLDFALAAVLFDPVELLRPGWPLHAELERLCARAPGSSAAPAHPAPAALAHPGASRVIGFGANSEGLPGNLRPDPAFAHGPLRLLPWLLRGEAAMVAEVGAALEDGLLENGMAAADTALALQDGFAGKVEHVRYLTVHDLAAMMAMQYEHAGLAPLWPLIETALLAADDEVWLDAAPEPLARYHGGDVRIALLDIDGWHGAGFAPAGIEDAQLPRAFERFQMRQRQFAAVLAAHGIAVSFDHCPAGGDPRAVLRA
ncbi:MAG TPA: hypothetical protein VFY12_12920 [Arenimonas sp.]|nr:hypothetical protein [Arenimonas sp.]